MNDISNPREAAFLALLYLRDGKYIENFFEEKSIRLAEKDLKLSKSIAFGTEKRLLSIEYLMNQLILKSGFKNFKLKRKERLLLYSALHQFFFMDRVPLFAIVNETVSIAKKYFGKEKAAFFNKVLRLLENIEVSLPEGVSSQDLSYNYSYPKFFIQMLLEEYGIDKAIDILKVQNLFFAPFVRLRTKSLPLHCDIAHDKKFRVAKITANDLSFFVGKPDFYIQNITPILLLEELLDTCEQISKNDPRTILDLCAAPGGKAIALHDIFPKASLVLNDSSKERIELLSENLKTYGIKAKTLNFSAEDISIDERFDLIILDVPCSNSGVLGKRPEARWRIDESSLSELQSLQLKIILNASKLLSPHGHILYMTCSILEKENEKVIAKVLESTSLVLKRSIKILPDMDGRDGGFGALLEIL